MTMSIHTEFPDYPMDSLPPIPASWTDTSYGNDTSPSWRAGNLHIWVDHPEQAQREWEGGKGTLSPSSTTKDA